MSKSAVADKIVDRLAALLGSGVPVDAAVKDC
jgi:hypothetical protein